ncbi:MAG: hypothetical protein KAS71_02485 [Bacteroidales bacterium]|nr:hypothetical protein [Bacteroidales bacterium]
MADTQSKTCHPLILLRKSEKDVDLVKTINSIPIGKLSRIEQMIKEEIKR